MRELLLVAATHRSAKDNQCVASDCILMILSQFSRERVGFFGVAHVRIPQSMAKPFGLTTQQARRRFIGMYHDKY
jgi:hypothetical protein